MIIVSSVRKETEVGIMIAHQLLSTGDMEMENQLNPINEEHSELGNTLGGHNGNRKTRV
jgi:hypothetical protein